MSKMKSQQMQHVRKAYEKLDEAVECLKDAQFYLEMSDDGSPEVLTDSQQKQLGFALDDIEFVRDELRELRVRLEKEHQDA